MDGDTPTWTIGQAATRTGLSVRTIRFWSDSGVVSAAGRTASGRRLYDAHGLARLELVATLRELGLGLAEVRAVADREKTLAEVAAVHVGALDAQIRLLRLRRSVLAVAAGRAMRNEEMTLMNKLARLSTSERRQIIDDFVTKLFRGIDHDEGFADRLRRAPDLPDDPTPEQVDAWVELAELVSDPDFRQRSRAMAEFAARTPPGQARPGSGPGGAEFAGRVLEHAGAALAQGIDPASAAARPVVEAILNGMPEGEPRRHLRESLEAGTDPRAERYWQLAGIINGWPPFPPHVPAFEWLIAALRAGEQPGVTGQSA
jgi:DNA-binding transcriptional MerR regulator